MKTLSHLIPLFVFCTICGCIPNETNREDLTGDKASETHDCVQPEKIDTLKDGLSHIYQFKYGLLFSLNIDLSPSDCFESFPFVCGRYSHKSTCSIAEEGSEWFKAKCYNTTVGEHSRNCACFYWAFRAHTSNNRTDLASIALESALKLAPKDPKLNSLMGEILTGEENFIEAAERFKTAAMYENKKSDDYEDDIMKHWYNAATAYVQVSRKNSIRSRVMNLFKSLPLFRKGGAH
jgi:hypothetical protein